jgi:predicted thioesterase
MVNTSVFNKGDTITIQKRVTEDDTALKYGSGKLETLFSTPSLVAMMIEASSKLLDEKLPEGFITVGKVAFVDHEKPTYLGEVVSLTVTVEECSPTKVVLSMKAFDEIGLIGIGHHHRYIVNKKALLERAHKREAEIDLEVEGY